MKIVDERGRLFGKVNLLDFAVIVFLLLLIPAVLISRGSPVKIQTVTQDEPKEIMESELTGNFVKIAPSIASKISVGDKETGEKGETIGEISWLGKPETYTSYFNIGGNTQIKSVDTATLMIPVKFKLKLEARGFDLFYKKQQVFLGMPLLFCTKDYSAKFVPVAFKETPEFKEAPEEKWVQIEVKFESVIPELANIIKTGDAENDLTGNAIGVVHDVNTKSSEVLVFMPKDGTLKAVVNPSLKELVVSFSILCREKDGDLYFNNSAVKIGNTFTFVTKTYSFSGKIIALKETK
ncbi:MAG: DUF4330 family protein [Candidatus Omnitrophica bacterium]|nr:DUF4330 family protein [Candidatus Omnitrophota bacterium]MDD5553537.1 DUF4330 family protein [Candidatus Omnitrophota bacterium]